MICNHVSCSNFRIFLWLALSSISLQPTPSCPKSEAAQIAPAYPPQGQIIRHMENIDEKFQGSTALRTFSRSYNERIASFCFESWSTNHVAQILCMRELVNKAKVQKPFKSTLDRLEEDDQAGMVWFSRLNEVKSSLSEFGIEKGILCNIRTHLRGNTEIADFPPAELKYSCKITLFSDIPAVGVLCHYEPC